MWKWNCVHIFPLQLELYLRLLNGDLGMSAVGTICSPGRTHMMGPSSLWERQSSFRLERLPHGRVICGVTHTHTRIYSNTHARLFESDSMFVSHHIKIKYSVWFRGYEKYNKFKAIILNQQWGNYGLWFMSYKPTGFNNECYFSLLWIFGCWNP